MHLLRSTLALLAPFAAVAAQGSVSGRVTLLEKAGQKTTDLANAVVWLEPLAGNSTRPKATKVEVEMKDRQFSPHVRVVPAGSTIDFPNQDVIKHNTFSTTPGSSFDLGLYGRGQTKSHQFTKVGAIPVYCNIHATMTSFVVVVPTQWFAQAGIDGRWMVTDVPPGAYELHVWHERAPKQTARVQVTAGRVDLPDMQLNAQGYVLVQHKDKLGQDYNAPGRIKY
jgi:plastocyanin